MTRHRGSAERGIAMIAALMIMLLMSALMVAFSTIVMSDQRFRGIDKERSRAFYGAVSGLEKLTADMGNLFLTNVAPTTAQVAALSQNMPTVPNVSFTLPAGAQAGSTAYGAVLVACDAAGDTSCNTTIQSGPYQGLMALKKDYKLDVWAVTTNGGDAHLTRHLETVAIPVFQFGTFSDVDLSFFAGPNFNFGGRVHTNGNLFLAEGDGNTLTLTDKVTAVGQIVRQQLANGVSINTATTHAGTISMAKASNSFRTLAPTEGSVVAGVNPTTLNTNWPTISLSTYNGYIRNGLTGAKPLNLPVITAGGANTDLVRRPAVNETTTNPTLFGERMFGKMSLRILLSDTAADITSLPTVTAIAPILLDGNWATTPPNNGGGVAFLGVGATIPGSGGKMPPIARSPGPNAATFTVNGALAKGATAVPFNGTVPTTFHVPTYPMAITSGAVTNSVTCTSVTATQLIGCVPAANWQAEATGAALPPVTINGVTYTATVNGAISSASNKNSRTLTINTGSNPSYTGAEPWSANTFWLTDISNGTSPPSSNPNGVSNYPTLVTCTGVDSTALGVLTQFSGCSNVPKTASGSAISTNAMSAADTGLVGGYLKIEMQDTTGVWHDVTMEILNWGFAAPNQDAPNQAGVQCADPTPNAIIRFQRLKDNGGAAVGTQACAAAGSIDPYDYWPNVLYDAREGVQRDKDPGNGLVTFGGLMNYVTLDVGNLSKWFAGTAPYSAGSGVNAYSNNGYGVYFSDRRSNRADGSNGTTANAETGEYGFEDIVNPLSATGVPNGTLDQGEDVNVNNALDVYGNVPSSGGVWNSLPGGGSGAYASAANVTPTATVTFAQGMVNRTYLFRRALKLTDGALNNIVQPGLTVATENPIYIQGDWNANQSGFGDPNAETSVMADAVTLLSNEWTDSNSFLNPYNSGNRPRNTTWYRVAVIAGKGRAFPWPSAGSPASDFGTDGGAHNFLRLLESGGTVNYMGATATFYYSRQAVGTYKGGIDNVVYQAPTRNYQFDTDFLNPVTLPPFTPVFRDVDITGYSQETRPGK